jgi:hypothetical protein
MTNRNTSAQNQHGIIKDQRGQEQPADKKRAQQSTTTGQKDKAGNVRSEIQKDERSMTIIPRTAGK